MKTNRSRAFTLIELLTVIAITAILMTLIVVPVFQSFNLTRAAEAFANAQTKGRVLVERISREIGGSVAVRDLSGKVPTTLNGAATSLPRSAVVAVVPPLKQVGPTTGQPSNDKDPRDLVEVALPYSKVDLVEPAQDGLRGPSGAYIDPVTGKEDPTLLAPKGQVLLPVAPGQTLVRYFVGLRDPFAPSAYNDPYDGLLNIRNSERDNLFVLYRAEVQPFIYQNVNGQLKRVTNATYFDSDPNTGLPIVDDPRFFVPNRDGAGAIIGNDAKAQRIRNWLAHAVVQTEVSRYDMVQPVYDRRSRNVTLIGTMNAPSGAGTLGIPQLLPLIQIRPSRVSNDPAKGETAVRMGEESTNAEAIGPDMLSTQFGLWSNYLIRTWPEGWVPSNPALAQYLIGDEVPWAGTGGLTPPGFSIFAYDPGLGLETDANALTELFDVYTYEQAITLNQGRAFTRAIAAANSRSGWLNTQRLRDIFTPYYLDQGKGRIIASFNIGEVGDTTKVSTIPDSQNLPTVSTDTVNTEFTTAWNAHPELRPEIHRFIDLRVTPSADGTIGPLDPDPTVGFPKARIVPGSEEVYGPDQIEGPDYGAIVRYVRTTEAPGPNQYRINYVNQPEPTNSSGQIDYSILGLSPTDLSGFNPNVYNPANFVSSVIQPRYKAGYLQLNSDPNVPLPAGAISVSYRFQFTGSQTGPNPTGAISDVFAVDYDSRQLMSVLLTIRNYAQSNLPNPQMVTLKATAAVRNYIR